jgi:putative SOS response-associated peptidase YedK
MCARFSLTSPLEALRKLFDFSEMPNLASSFNIPPTSQIAIFTNSANPDDKHQFVNVHWGLIPAWAKDPSVGVKMINARSETVHEKPSFKEAFQKRRCLIPANGFYEWRKEEDGSKQPYYFSPTQGNIFAFAGLWENWVSADTSHILSCTILTQEAPLDMSHIHHRFPVTLKPENFKDWLDGTDRSSLPDAEAQIDFNYHAVDKKVGNVRNQGADLNLAIKTPAPSAQGSLF